MENQDSRKELILGKDHYESKREWILRYTKEVLSENGNEFASEENIDVDGIVYELQSGKVIDKMLTEKIRDFVDRFDVGGVDITKPVDLTGETKITDPFLYAIINSSVHLAIHRVSYEHKANFSIQRHILSCMCGEIDFVQDIKNTIKEWIIARGRC